MEVMCLDFINTWWYIDNEVFSDPLLDQEWMDEFCAEWEISSIDVSRDKDMNRLFELRDFLKEIVQEFSKSKKLSKDTLKKLNSYLSSQMIFKEIKLIDGKYMIETIPEENNFNWFIYKVVLSFAELISECDPGRIKLCGNPDCGWIFYDMSKGMTRKWCDSKCASLMKVRRYREKHKKIAE